MPVTVVTHDTSRTKYHIADLGTFASRLENVGHEPVSFIDVNN
jgi:hypothetical protein